MKNTYIHIERYFEKITSIVAAILGNSITFILALVLVIFWLTNRDFATQELNEGIRDLIHGVAFLSLFVIQKEFSRFSGSLHLKINELVASNKKANNAVINVEHKTEQEIFELSKEYTILVEQLKEVEAIVEETKNV